MLNITHTGNTVVDAMSVLSVGLGILACGLMIGVAVMLGVSWAENRRAIAPRAARAARDSRGRFTGE